MAFRCFSQREIEAKRGQGATTIEWRSTYAYALHKYAGDVPESKLAEREGSIHQETFCGFT